MQSISNVWLTICVKNKRYSPEWQLLCRGETNLKHSLTLKMYQRIWESDIYKVLAMWQPNCGCTSETSCKKYQHQEKTCIWWGNILQASRTQIQVTARQLEKNRTHLSDRNILFDSEWKHPKWQNGQHLVIVHINLEHDYEIVTLLYDHLLSKRKLTDKKKEKVSEMLHVNANKKRIQQHISHSTWKVALLKEIHNIKTGKNHKKTTTKEGNLEK